MNRAFFKVGAVACVTAVAALSAGPAFASTTLSQATAQSLQLSVAGHSAVSQIVTATNDGSGEKKNDASTVPTLATVLGSNNILGAGVAPQDAGATVDKHGNGDSYACAGLAGSGGGVAVVGNSKCDVRGSVIHLGLGTLNLNLTDLLGPGGLSGPLGKALSGITVPVGQTLDGIISQLTDALNNTPLGQIGISGALSAVEATCSATPTAATGDDSIVDTSGGHTIPIAVTIPTGTGGTQTLDVANLDVDVAPKPGGTDVLLNLSTVTQAVITAVDTELDTAVGGAISSIGGVVGTLLSTVQSSIVDQLTTALQPLLQQLDDNILKLTINDVTPSDGGKAVEATALNLQVLPAAATFVGSSLVSGIIGHVTCGPNAKAAGSTPTPTPTPTKSPGVPRHVDSGLAGDSGNSNNHNAIIAGVAALLAVAGSAGTLAYRRYGMPRG